MGLLDFATLSPTYPGYIGLILQRNNFFRNILGKTRARHVYYR
jgi:hypothetical protein